MVARLLSVNVGLPKDIDWRGKTVHTAVWKEPVYGRRTVRRLNIDGDGQGDLKGHGGEHRAVMVYQIDSYRYWERYFGRKFPACGQFGENLTVDGLPDDEVCIGDRYQIGSALLEVTQPRVTCYRVGIRVNEPLMASLLVAHHRPGFYMRVLQEGDIGAGDEIVKVSAGPEQMTVAEIDALLYLPGHAREQLQRALKIPALPAGWQASFRALLEQEQGGKTLNGNSGLAQDSGPPPAWPGFRKVRVSAVNWESKTVFSLLLTSGDGSPLAVARPGQFVVLRVRTRPDSPPLLRSYSLSGAPSTDHYRVSIKEETHGAVSGYLKNNVRVGDALDISAPRGNFLLRQNNDPVVLLSAGVGVTPVLAMLHALACVGTNRRVWWLFGARNREDHPFAAEVRRLLSILPNAKSYLKYSQPGHEDDLGKDFNAPGRLTIADIASLRIPDSAHFYICGPPSFMDDLSSGLRTRGVPASQIHSEVFGSLPPKTPGIKSGPSRMPHQPPAATDEGPKATFARSGLTVSWASRYQSLLELAEACDVPARWSCRTGVCHTCETGLISGSVSYQIEPIEPAADGSVLLCCSRPESDVVLDM
ncbi:MAG TPA: MOSC and FAD-binding oxidoreductase domain-containing protein [Acidobacteriaceae bacterium]|nr:MOSC and FAD-binding oxidoreductase domain-containing protein [Acidobacteriaceae bacterium]